MVVTLQGDQESDEVPKNISDSGESSGSIDGGSVVVTKQDKMVESAAQKHALAERERRKRINNHYASLRQLFPRLLKTDKASVLTETVRHFKELRSMVAIVAWPHEDEDWCSIHQPFPIPGENDEVSVSYCDSGDKTIVRATICCEDRPNLNQGLTEAIRSVNGKAVKAKMATVGGRTKVDMVVEWPQCSDREEHVGMLRRALKAVVENQVLGRADFMGHGSTEPNNIGLGRRFVKSYRPIRYDQTENGYADGLITRSL